MSCVRLFSLVCIVLALPGWGYAQSETPSHSERVEALRPYVTPLRSVDPSDEDFSDLAPLKDLIRDRRMIILGEPTHGDGTAFLAKSRLVKFLHREMDFDVLAFETGLYDLRWATAQASSTEEYVQAAAENLSRPWAQSKQARPVLRYAAQTTQTNDSLHLAGIDIATRHESVFRRQLRAHLERNDLWQSHLIDANIETPIRKLLANPMYRPDSTTYRQFVEGLRELADQLRGGNGKDVFWAQMIENVDAMAQTAWERRYGPRNRQMADNLAWLAREAYSGEKVIVWVASSHGIRNLSSIERINADRSYEGQTSMGDYLANRFGGGIYTLGVTAHEGTYGAFYWEQQESQKISPPSKNSLEDLLGALSYDYSLLDFTTVPDSHWLSQPQVARPLGYEEMRADWTTVMDGMLFIRSMEPNTKIQD